MQTNTVSSLELYFVTAHDDDNKKSATGREKYKGFNSTVLHRYGKRGVNEKCRVANDVKTEQIVPEDVPEGEVVQITFVVQNRGSISLIWLHATSHLNLKPNIILSKRDEKYEATRLHFDHLVKRYRNPIIILNLIKANEKKPRESILREEFANVIEIINKDLPGENKLQFLHLDMHKHSGSYDAQKLHPSGIDIPTRLEKNDIASGVMLENASGNEVLENNSSPILVE